LYDLIVVAVVKVFFLVLRPSKQEHIETDVTKTRAQLVSAACGVWRPLLIEYILNLYASIPHQLHSGNSQQIFFYKVLNISGNINSFLYRKSMFLLLTSVVSFVRCRHFYDTLLATHCSFFLSCL